ncbi:MAG TPA: GGDEF domain-containing protein [Stellaceae bacterium]|nr:GGDEF domain-containing protein [Stellaceae bacterium]
MAFTAHTDLSADEAIRLEPRQRKGRLVRLMPATGDQTALRAWALSIVTAADKRVAELEARLAYLEDLAVTDELTGALNRRGFLVEFSRAIDAARRGGPKGVLIICDLDGFKTVNDRLGHAFGDDLLRQLGRILTRGVRKMDVAARLGGDEFALILIGADLAIARHRVEGFARSIAALAPKLNGLALPLSASFGLAAFDGNEDEESVLHRADMSMYAHKGRSRRTERHPLQAAG